ncbi:hypothetical protein FA13DRAFT_1793810 [Coprinellus micaceus]|uniref:DUF6533 domain-containing protein n=1 Tax=Coprinellus micaceus TaxID=71717 RepID=A0A4Y7T398_COPMI|nr:hypothetical protein FA13DRAFT_1793810 [Coprinellus micaceus]
MSLSPESVLALQKDVLWWRMQDYGELSFFVLYLYHAFTTIDEEISVIHPQRWNRGKMLYMVIRYGMLLYIVLKFSRDFKSYLPISPETCKGLVVANNIAYAIVYLACNFLLGLCLSALLQAKIVVFLTIMTLCLALPFISTVLEVVGSIQYPGKSWQPRSVIVSLRELGYTCYVLSYQEKAAHTIAFIGDGVRVHLSLAAIALLNIIGVVTLVVRYKAQAGRLLQVVRRDGSIYYLSVLAIRLAFAIIHSYASLPTSRLEHSPGIMCLYTAADVLIPILAERLLVNMRKVDYVGTEPVASRLLFAPPPRLSAKERNDDLDDSMEMTLTSSRDRLHGKAYSILSTPDGKNEA